MSASDSDLTFTERARRAQIVQATVDTVNSLGYHRTSLSEIAKTAGVAKSAIVYYFGTKETLLMTVLEETFDVLGQRIISAVERETEPEAKLRAYARAYLAHIDCNRAALAASITIVLSHRTADGTPLYLTEDAEDTALLRSILGAGMDAGVFRRMPVADAAAICDSVLNLPITAIQRDLDADLTAFSAELIEFMMAGLQPVSP